MAGCTDVWIRDGRPVSGRAGCRHRISITAGLRPVNISSSLVWTPMYGRVGVAAVCMEMDGWMDVCGDGMVMDGDETFQIPRSPVGPNLRRQPLDHCGSNSPVDNK